MSTPYEYSDDRGLRVALDHTAEGMRLRIAVGPLGTVTDLSVPAAERLYMAIGSALTRHYGQGR